MTSAEEKLIWRGRPVEDLTREELLVCAYSMARENQRLRGYTEFVNWKKKAYHDLGLVRRKK